MRSTPYSTPGKEKGRPPPRKKACRNCSRSKVRCDLARPACTRCKSLGRSCEYTVPNPAPRLGAQGDHAAEDVDGSWIDQSIAGPEMLDPVLRPSSGITRDLGGATIDAPNLRNEQNFGPAQNGQHELDLTNTDLVPSLSAHSIRDRWLRPYILPPLGSDEIPKVYHPFTLQYVSRVLSTYPNRMLKDGDVSPFIHHSQVSGSLMPLALANCYTLMRMWTQAAPGSETMVVNTIEQEMDRLTEGSSNIYDIDHLSAFQAFLVYSILLYFSPPPGTTPVTDKTMITLMELAYLTARNGLISAAERSKTKPTWESWIVASTKRRAIHAMYLFSSVYNAEHSLPNFVAEELRGVYVPESKALWEARDRGSWSREYDNHLREWGEGMLEISELWKSEETGSIARRRRIERWLKMVDEFGMMLFSVCAHLHGC
ncbi:Zn(II)2Cys6 transcription factor domain-containing protein [Aspergillus lucknowensis]|uniref:Zn(2)-C6 fungal-type domain-containing protein n=1 Tax=Aspergillus lucknowensis TaxID=176173 RepID=A0ABR4LWQ3_9EURO